MGVWSSRFLLLIVFMRLLFVCTGNICRSPTAEAIMRHLIGERADAGHLLVDSAGTHSYHVGEPPDPRSIAYAKERGIAMDDLVARQVQPNDYQQFDILLALDQSHLNRLRELRPDDATADIALMLDYAGLGPRDVPDPYYGGQQAFVDAFSLIEEGVQGVLERVLTGTDADRA